MGSFNLYANKGALIKLGSPGSNFTPKPVEAMEGGNSIWHLYGFENFPTNLLFKPIQSVQPWLFFYGHLTSANAWCVALGESFDPSTVTWNTMPAQSEYLFQSNLQYYDAILDQYCPFFQLGDQSSKFDAIRYGLRFSGTGYFEYDSTNGTHKPYLEITYGDADVTPNVTGSPQSGYVDKQKSSTFGWYLSGDEACVGTFQQTAATFSWRVGTSGEVHSISAGASTIVTVPAGTFPTGTIQWKVSVTVNSGATVETPWYSVSTVEALSTAQTVSPVSTLVDGRAPVVFRWKHVISTGTLPTRSDLQIFVDDAWADFATVTGSSTEYIAPVGALSAGQTQWRVRTYNTDGAAGAWSDSASIVVVASPPTPVVSATQTPRPTITWQSDGQQAYEVELDGVTVSDFGTDKEIRWPEYLADGTYIANVRVQNIYGLWSEFGAAQIVVSNVPGDSIDLSVFSDYDARLQWTTTGGYSEYAVYRDGKLIGKTDVPYFTDRYSIGSVQYHVIGMMSDSDYFTKSNTETVTVRSDVTRLYNSATEQWLDLPLVDEQYRTWNLELAATASYFHTSGADFPSVEVSRFRDKSIRFSVSVLTPEECVAIESCIGKLICVKHKGNEMTIGVSISMNKTVGDFYTSYFITLQQVQPEEVVTL